MQQLLLFDDVPPCRYCGGVGAWEDAGHSNLGCGYPLIRFSCTKCTFATGRMVEKCKEKMLQFWSLGVPRLIYCYDKKRDLNSNEYYQSFKLQKPQARYYGFAYCMADSS